MKKTIITSCVLLILTCSLWAQKKINFSSKNYFGIVSGENGTNPQLQTINGFKFNRWFTGIGTGFDWYYQRSVPLFLSVDRYFLMKPRRNFILSGDAGVNFPWKYKQFDEGFSFGPSKMTPGLYWAAGFGYRIGVGRQNDAVLLHIGYINKFYKEKTSYTNPCLIGPCPVNEESYNYNLKGVSVKIGYGF